MDRKSELGVPLIQQSLYDQLFPDKSSVVSRLHLKFAQEHLSSHGLDKIEANNLPPVDIQLPRMLDSDILTHVHKLSLEVAEPYYSWAKRFASVELPPMPSLDTWLIQTGWVRYAPGENPVSVHYPLEPALVFDVETAVKVGKYPTLAVAVSNEAWYCWISTQVFRGGDQLIPMGDSPKLIVGHNVAYDWARVEEAYEFKRNPTEIRKLDTLSLHVCVSGISGQQRKQYLALKSAKEKGEESPYSPAWFDAGSMNSLKEVYQHYCGIEMDKTSRDLFVDGSLEDIKRNLRPLIGYCATDVLATHRVFSVVLPRYLRSCPHPASFAGMLEIGNSMITVDRTWSSYIAEAEYVFRKKSKEVEDSLIALAHEALVVENPQADPWLKNLDWEVPPYLTKKGEVRKNIKAPGKPNWYKDCLTKEGLKITTRSRITPYLLRLTWMGYPLRYSSETGWGYVVPRNEIHSSNFEPVELEDWEGYYYKMPHKDGDKANVGNPLAKDYLSAVEDGVLSSENMETAGTALNTAVACSYWVSIRERVRNQFVVWKGAIGIIIPQIIVCGTVTRRATESTFYTASSAKPNRIGSELKTKFVAPPGYKIVGADVDSEELWLSALLGDALYGMHGATAMGMQVLLGRKEDGTDPHSLTAKLMDISRDAAKVMVYSRIYGAGEKAAVQYLRAFNKALSEPQALGIAKKMFAATKGVRDRDTWKWVGGTESHTFNELELIAKSHDPRTPVLNAAISEALHPIVVQKDHMTSRINWGVQSSGRDFLDLLVVITMYLARDNRIDARLGLTLHDEARFIVKDSDVANFTLVLQISHVWVRAFISAKLGIYDLPDSVAWFTAVDVDTCWRKDPTSLCVTPSNSTPIPPGETWDIYRTARETYGCLF